jgi:hypothetical protein
LDVNSPLTGEQLWSLRAVDEGRLIAAERRAELVRLGFVEEKLSGLVLTRVGRMRLDLER